MKSNHGFVTLQFNSAVCTVYDLGRFRFSIFGCCNVTWLNLLTLFIVLQNPVS